MSKEEVISIAKEYAKKFTSNFLALATDSWYYDAMDWFDYNYGSIRDEDGDLYATPDERDWFAEEITKLFDDKYQDEYGLIDDYYYLKGIIYDIKHKTISQLESIQHKYKEGKSIYVPNEINEKFLDACKDIEKILKETNNKFKIEE